MGDTIAPAGLYASDHDLFAVLVGVNFTLSITEVVFTVMGFVEMRPMGSINRPGPRSHR